MQLVVQPCGDPDAREHFVDTIQSPVPISRIFPHLTLEQRSEVGKAFGERVAVWGVTPAVDGKNRRQWERMEIGATALLYRSKEFFFKGTVAYKLHSRALAEELWSVNDDGSTWDSEINVLMQGLSQ